MTHVSTHDLDFVRKVIHDESGMVLSADKEYLLDSRLRSLARREGFSSPSELVSRLRDARNPSLRRSLVEAVLIAETYFFRDGHPFETLERTILPELIRRCEGERRLNLWCAAASTGQEPYSVAIVLAEGFPALSSWSMCFLATDLSETVLERARGGLYTEAEISRGMSEPLRSRYFDREASGFRIRDDLRQRIEFTRMNLVGTWLSMPPMDLVLMRNILIYFDTATRESIVRRLSGLIRPGGYFLLGASEALVEEAVGFTPIRVGSTVCYRRDG